MNVDVEWTFMIVVDGFRCRTAPGFDIGHTLFAPVVILEMHVAGDLVFHNTSTFEDELGTRQREQDIEVILQKLIFSFEFIGILDEFEFIIFVWDVVNIINEFSQRVLLAKGVGFGSVRINVIVDK